MQLRVPHLSRKRPTEIRIPTDALARLEALERRELLSAVTIGQEFRSYSMLDHDGDRIVIALRGPGSMEIQTDGETGIASMVLNGATRQSTLSIRVNASGGGDGIAEIASILGGELGTLDLRGIRQAAGHSISLTGALGALRVAGGFEGVSVDAQSIGFVAIRGSMTGATVRAAGAIRSVRISGDMAAGSLVSAGTDVSEFMVKGEMRESMVLAGAEFSPNSFGDLSAIHARPASINRIRIGGDVVDSVLSAGGSPGTDGVFENGEVLPGGSIDDLRIGGVLDGGQSIHPNPGVYAAALGKVFIAGQNLTGKADQASDVVRGSAVLDPLPAPGIALAEPEIRRILEQAIAQATLLGVNATISMVDREGNILAVVRMTNGALAADPGTSTISAGGIGGLEGVTVASSITATSKAGTAAFLSTKGNAFSTRTAGFIIQGNFPRRVDFRPGGPLFGVQFSSLPTSDINRLPLGLAADPGGVPLYRNGEVVAGIGVELDGAYTAPGSDPGHGAKTTLEERIAVAGQIGFEPPKKIRATRIFVDGLRLALSEAKIPKIASLGALPDYTAMVIGGALEVLVAPQVSLVTKFTAVTVIGVTGETILRAGGSLTIAGALVGGQQLTAGDVESILNEAVSLNDQLRAQIRKDRPQKSQVSISVVDIDGTLLGTFRTGDAPVFGFDVSVQKARTASFFSRPDAGTLLRAAEGGAFASYADRAASFGIALDGSVAVADRTGGFLSRPFFPDGIPGNPPGPFSANAPDRFSPFNTGLQTALLTSNLVGFLTDFAAVGSEGLALQQFAAGTIGGGGVAAASLPIANGIQIFPGSIPLYKNGVLVGGIGVSGDGIEQDDFIAFTGGQQFQDFGAGVRRADQVMVMGIRLPYVKFPRSPFGGF